MPELPELEAARKSVERALVGHVISAVDVLRPTVLRGVTPSRFASTLVGKRIKRVARRGKALLFDLSAGWVLIFRPMLWGLLRLTHESAIPDLRAGIVLRLGGGMQLAFRELQLSTLTLARAQALDRDPYFRQLGIDPLSATFDRDYLATICQARGAIRAILTDQEHLAGIGNLWAHEILHAARLHPSRPAVSLTGQERDRLFRAMGRVLRTGIRLGGEPEFVDARGRRGRYPLAVYGRGGQRCPRGDGIIRASRAGGRPSFFCPGCQR